MAAIDITRPLATGLLVGIRISHFVSNTYEAIANWHSTRATKNELAKLSNHELADIGLSRGDIDRIGTTSPR